MNILITGASSGIGRAVAAHLLDKGWEVGLLARSRDALEDLANGRDKALVLEADVTDPAAVEAAFDAHVARFGRIDVLFNNAGIFGKAAPIDEIDLDTWHQVVSVNLNGMFYCARAAFARMRRQAPQGGRIINNGSISAHVPRDGSVCYTTTKHAITGMTRTLSLDGRAFNIACGQIDIGNARTPMVEDQIYRANASGKNPDATMDVRNVAEAVEFMATRDLEANVQFMTVMATTMPYIGRG
ncbi:SDR family oxidoreductase [Thetidibacter halocola]|uniref:SDR family oxidoreductase n=1 Tax=Thetidibacter halocola TaxID=2827239 RepID=A0A8J7WFB9_9RHOB|nr:SDR family oxidoreductase [Thetidibacter halocola]MBS0124656.1 SDR family oxidoreductase [Thetidibacter halocola]